MICFCYCFVECEQICQLKCVILKFLQDSNIEVMFEFHRQVVGNETDFKCEIALDFNTDNEMFFVVVENEIGA